MKFLVAYKHFREYTLTSTARERSRQEGRLVEEIEVVGNSQWALSNSYILADLAWRLSFATSSDNRVRKNRTRSPTWLWSLSASLPSRAVTPGRSSCQCGSIGGSSRHPSHQRPIFLCASVGCPSDSLLYYSWYIVSTVQGFATPQAPSMPDIQWFDLGSSPFEVRINLFIRHCSS